jgi:hypothetical protein
MRRTVVLQAPREQSEQLLQKGLRRMNNRDRLMNFRTDHVVSRTQRILSTTPWRLGVLDVLLEQAVSEISRAG